MIIPVRGPGRIICFSRYEGDEPQRQTAEQKSGKVSREEALCDFHGLVLYNFLEAGDVLEENAYDVKELAGANHNLGKLMIALEIAKRI